MKASNSAEQRQGVRLTFNQRGLVALCASMLLVALTYLVIGVLLVANRAAADGQISRMLSELEAPISAGVLEGVFQLAFGLCDLVLFGLGLWGSLRPRHMRPFLVLTGVGLALQGGACVWGLVDGTLSANDIRSLIVFATFFGFSLATRREWRSRLQYEGMLLTTR